MAKIIVLKGEPIHKEAAAAAAITPGHLIEQTVAGALKPHGTAGGRAVPAFAVEAGFLGRDIDTAYAVDEQAFYAVCEPGCEVYALLAVDQAVDPTTFLTSNGDGTLKAAGVDDVAVARAAEAVDSTGASEPVRVIVEVI